MAKWFDNLCALFRCADAEPARQPAPTPAAADTLPGRARAPTVPPALAREPVEEPVEEPAVNPLPFDLDKKHIIYSVLSVFETGKTEPDYMVAVVLKDGAGVTYGKHQGTDRGGSLDAIMLRYIDRGGLHADELRPFVKRLVEDETALVDPDDLPSWVDALLGLLRLAGEDPIMQQAQDDVFEERYWAPAANQAVDMGLVLPLSWLVCYDSTIHSGTSGIANIRKRFAERPPTTGGEEKPWTIAYLFARRDWLSAHANPVVRATVYRIDSLLQLVDDDNWALDTPVQIKKPRATVT